MAFFSTGQLKQTKPRESKIAKCGLCRLYKGCKSPKMEPFGKGKRKILVVGEAPGENEDESGRPFIGKAGTYLKKALAQIGINMDKDCWLTNTLICRPPKNATPTSEQIEYCHPNMTKTIRELNPEIIITTGRCAIESVLRGYWTESVGALNRWVGWQIPSRDLNCWICPTYHPSYLLRETSGDRKRSPIEDIFIKHLKSAVKLEGRPYAKPHDLRKEVKILMDTQEILRYFNKYRITGGSIAFDFETNMLKPDSKQAYIRSAAVCWKGQETISFPMLKEDVVEGFKRLLVSRLDKIAHNMKFEDRWCRKKLGVEVVNWFWDTMTMTHVYDNRKEICSLSFQSMAELGVACYGEEISPFLQQSDSYSPNRIEELDWDKLLLYGGMDALCTHMLYEKQYKVLRSIAV